MGGVLVDTHVVLWMLSDPERLGEQAKALLSDEPVWVSAASLWEIAIKQQVGKLQVRADPAAALAEAGVSELAVSWRHLDGYADLDLPHRDPFDRVLLNQARTEGLTLLTADRALLATGLNFVADARR